MRCTSWVYWLIPLTTASKFRGSYICLRVECQPSLYSQFQDTQMYILRPCLQGAGEMAQQLRILATLREVLSSNFSNHMVAHNNP